MQNNIHLPILTCRSLPYEGTKGTVEIKEVTDYNEDGTPVYGATGEVSFDAEVKIVNSFDFIDYRLEGAEDAEGMVLVYDGLEKEPKFASLSVNGVPVNKDEYELSYVQNINVPTNPKRPPLIYVTFKGERFTGESALAFTITAADISNLNIKPVSFVADGNSHTPVFDSGIEGSAMRFRVLEGWYKATTDEENNVTGYEPAEEGEEGAFYSTKTATEKGNYQALIESTNKINCIGQRVIDWSIADIQYVSKTYDGEAVDNADFTIDNLVGEYGEDSVSVAYYAKNADVTSASPIAAPIDAGNYRAVVTITDKNTEEGHVVLPTLTKTVDFTIAKKNIVVAPEKTSKTYLTATPDSLGGTATNPEGVTGDVIVARDKNTLEPEVKNLFKLESAVALDAPIGTESKIIFNNDVKAKFSNYELGYTSTDFRVVKKSITDATVTLNSSSYTYDGSVKCPALTVKATGSDGAEVTLTEGTDFTIDVTAVLSATNASTYSIKLNGIGNYEGGNVVTWTITQKNIADYISENSTAGTSDAVTVTGATYDGNEHTPTIAVEELTVEGAPTDAGTYLVTATAVRRGYENATATAQFTITPKEVTISVTGAVDSITYGDTLPTLGKEVVGVLEGEDLGLTGDYQIVKDGTAVTETVPNAGTYTIKGNFVATNQNYTITPETKAFTILKKDLEDVDNTIEIVSELTNAIADYGVTEAPAFTVVYKAQTGNKTLVSDVANSETYDYAVNAPTVLADGNYTIEVVGEGNYTGIRETNWTVTETDEAKEAARAAIAEAAKVEFTDFSIVSESNKRIGVTVHGAVESPEGKNYTVLKTGLVAYRGKELPEGTKLTIEEADGTTIYNLSKGINYSSSTMKDTEDSIYIRGYVIVGDGTYKAVKLYRN